MVHPEDQEILAHRDLLGQLEVPDLPERGDHGESSDLTETVDKMGQQDLLDHKDHKDQRAKKERLVTMETRATLGGLGLLVCLELRDHLETLAQEAPLELLAIRDLMVKEDRVVLTVKRVQRDPLDQMAQEDLQVRMEEGDQ